MKDKDRNLGFTWAVLSIFVIACVVLGVYAWKSEAPSSVDELLSSTQPEPVDATITRDGGEVRLENKNVKPGAPHVEIFEDFSCPHCAALHKADKNSLLKAVNNGDMTLSIHTMNFMDQGFRGSSTRGAEVALAAAEAGDSSAYWNTRTFLLEHQDVTRRWDDPDYRTILNHYAHSDKPTAELDKLDSRAAGDMNDENSDKLARYGSEVSTPRVFVDGQQINTSDTTGKPKDWVPAALLGGF